MAPLARALADLLGKLALRRLEDVLPLLVELPGGDLEHRLVVNGLARLADEEDALAIMGHDADRARVGDDLALGLLAVVVAEAVHADLDDLAVVGDVPADALEAHQRLASSASTMPPARAARKKSSSSLIERPIV